MMACGKEKKTLLQYKYQKSNFQLCVKSSLGSHWLYFASLCGPENSHHPLSQSEAERQPIPTSSFMFFPRIRQFAGFHSLFSLVAREI